MIVKKDYEDGVECKGLVLELQSVCVTAWALDEKKLLKLARASEDRNPNGQTSTTRLAVLDRNKKHTHSQALQ